ncbi:MAG: DUF3365 domain-containing protein [gamma proteobacterium symbiont of Taylorina sp.]|nr:DUF3365 domain-containing protein [gamma proteobacterium symbiont of Taylorina sp.]
MSIQTKLLAMIGSMLILTFLTMSYFNYQKSMENAKNQLFEQADKVRNLLMAYRHTGQKVFIEKKLKLTDQNLGLLPAYAIGQMSKVYPRWDKSGFSFNNVSDQPRNPDHQADALELEIMDYFRKNDVEKTVFKPFINEKGENYFIYARPIWIKKMCLRCHAKREDAPKTIREKYDTAFNYQLGDLRGLLSIKMPAETIEQYAKDIFYQNAKIQLFSLITIFIVIMLLIRSSILRPLFLLSTAMTDVSNGNYSKRIDGLNGEFKNMQATFNTMGQELEKNQQELENRVEQRTHELSTANQELTTTLDSLKAAQQQLIESEKMASLGGLVAGVAHEINTPIGVGVTAASHLHSLNEDLMKKFESNSLKKSDFENYVKNSEEAGNIILNNLERAAELIRSFKQIAVDQSHDNHREINIKQYIDECLLSLKPLLKKSQHRVEIICPEEIQFNCNPGQFSQIITNLFINAIRHAYDQGQTGHIKLEIHQDNEKIHFHFSDDGKGISEEHLSDIFIPFFTTARSNGGSGLGLSTIYNIITQNMQGTLSCESSPDQGTHFYFSVTK